MAYEQMGKLDELLNQSQQNLLSNHHGHHVEQIQYTALRVLSSPTHMQDGAADKGGGPGPGGVGRGHLGNAAKRVHYVCLASFIRSGPQWASLAYLTQGSPPSPPLSSASLSHLESAVPR